MMTYILNERDEAVPVSWEDYAAWWCDNREELIIAVDDVRDRRNKYITTVRTFFRGSTERVEDVWVTEADDGSLRNTAGTRKGAMDNHRRCIKFLENCYCK